MKKKATDLSKVLNSSIDIAYIGSSEASEQYYESDGAILEPDTIRISGDTNQSPIGRRFYSAGYDSELDKVVTGFERGVNEAVNAISPIDEDWVIIKRSEYKALIGK